MPGWRQKLLVTTLQEASYEIYKMAAS